MRYVRDLTIEPYKGIKADDTKYIPTGFSSDDLTDCLMSRKLSFIFGQSEEGKTVIAHRIALNAIDNNFKVLIVDGEYYQEELIRELYLKIIGNNKALCDFVRPNRITYSEPKQHIMSMLQEWHKNKIYILSKNECDFNNFEEMFNVIVDAVKKYSIDYVVLDNMMSLVQSTQAERNSAQADFVKNIIMLNRRYNCHSSIVNHPRKQSERGSELDIFDMSGTSDMPNMADIVFIVQRIFDKSEDEFDGYLHLKKNKLNGKHSKMPLIYQESTRTYLEYKNNVLIDLKLDWQREGKQRSVR